MDKRKIIIFALLALFSLGVTFKAQLKLLANEYSVCPDTRESIIMMAHLRDPELFQHDLHLVYESWKAPLGIKLFYAFTGLFFQPLAVVKVLPFFLCLILVFYGYKLGAFLGNKRTGIIAAVLLVLSAWYREHSFVFSDVWFAEGGAGAFYPILLLMFIFYLVKKDFLKASITIILQSLFYPPAVLISLFTYALTFINYIKGRLVIDLDKKKWACFLVSLLIVLSVMIPKYLNPPDALGDVVGINQMRHMAEFYEGGRTPVFYNDFKKRILNFRSGLGLDRVKIVLLHIAFLLGALGWRKSITVGKPMWALLFSSLILFGAANIFLLGLFEPERYVRFSIIIFLIFFVSLNLDNQIRHFFKKRKQIGIFYGLLFIGVLLMYYPHINSAYSVDKDEKLYDFISQTPKNTLIAAHPRTMDNIVVFCLRRGLVMEELSFPYLTGYYKKISERTYAFFDAYYSNSKFSIMKFCKKYDINYFVVKKEHFTAEYLNSKNYYYNPFNNYILNVLEKNEHKDFALLDFAQSKIVFENNEYIVLRCF